MCVRPKRVSRRRMLRVPAVLVVVVVAVALFAARVMHTHSVRVALLCACVHVDTVP